MALETERREGVIYIWMFYIPLLCKSLYIYICACIERHFSRLCACVSHSVVSDSFATPRTVAHQASLSIGFSRQEYWSGFPFPSPGDLSRLAASKPRGRSGWSCSSVSKGCVTASLFIAGPWAEGRKVRSGQVSVQALPPISPVSLAVSFRPSLPQSPPV